MFSHHGIEITPREKTPNQRRSQARLNPRVLETRGIEDNRTEGHQQPPTQKILQYPITISMRGLLTYTLTLQPKLTWWQAVPLFVHVHPDMVLDRTHPRVHFSKHMPSFCPTCLVAYFRSFVYHVLARLGSHSLRFSCIHGFAIHHGQSYDKPSLRVKLKLSFEALL